MRMLLVAAAAVAMAAPARAETMDTAALGKLLAGIGAFRPRDAFEAAPLVPQAPFSVEWAIPHDSAGPSGFWSYDTASQMLTVELSPDSTVRFTTESEPIRASRFYFAGSDTPGTPFKGQNGYGATTMVTPYESVKYGVETTQPEPSRSVRMQATPDEARVLVRVLRIRARGVLLGPARCDRDAFKATVSRPIEAHVMQCTARAQLTDISLIRSDTGAVLTTTWQ